MDNQHGRTPTRDRQITKRQKDVSEIANFIIQNDTNNKLIAVVDKYYWNFLKHIDRLYDKDQILMQRSVSGDLVALCGWARIRSTDEAQLNKITWALPDDISTGNILHITFCIVHGGQTHLFRRELNKMMGREIDQICWFNLPKNKYFRRKNILKGELHASDRSS